jgi:hypothetical protein
MPGEPKRENVDTTADTQHEHAAAHLLSHLELREAEERPPAQLRLEEAVGPELARRLLASLTQANRR